MAVNRGHIQCISSRKHDDMNAQLHNCTSNRHETHTSPCKLFIMAVSQPQHTIEFGTMSRGGELHHGACKLCDDGLCNRKGVGHNVPSMTYMLVFFLKKRNDMRNINAIL